MWGDPWLMPLRPTGIALVGCDAAESLPGLRTLVVLFGSLKTLGVMSKHLYWKINPCFLSWNWAMFPTLVCRSSHCFLETPELLSCVSSSTINKLKWHLGKKFMNCRYDILNSRLVCHYIQPSVLTYYIWYIISVYVVTSQAFYPSDSRFQGLFPLRLIGHRIKLSHQLLWAFSWVASSAYPAAKARGYWSTATGWKIGRTMKNMFSDLLKVWKTFAILDAIVGLNPKSYFPPNKRKRSYHVVSDQANKGDLQPRQKTWLRPEIITYNSVISSCQKAMLWPPSLQLLDQAAAVTGVQPDKTFSGSNKKKHALVENKTDRFQSRFIWTWYLDHVFFLFSWHLKAQGHAATNSGHLQCLHECLPLVFLDHFGSFFRLHQNGLWTNMNKSKNIYCI